MSRIRIKVSDISSLTDARYCAGMGVQYLSICFDDSGNTRLDPTAFHAIRAWIEGVEWMGEFSGNNAAVLRDMANAWQLTAWIIKHPELRTVPELDDLQFILSATEADCENRDSESLEIEIGSEEKKDTVLAKAASGSGQMRILKNPASASEIVQLHQQFPELIFNLNSGEEERPGWMDLSHLQDILEELEENGFYLL
jgi:phosphoribosylanthranilate isomerase